MLALYRSGRQAAALRAYQLTRERLAEELGIEASPALRMLEQQILEQDPSLTLMPSSPAPALGPGRSPPVEPPRPTPKYMGGPQPLDSLRIEQDEAWMAPVVHLPARDNGGGETATPEAFSGIPASSAVVGKPAVAKPEHARSRLAIVVKSIGLAIALGVVLIVSMDKPADTNGAPSQPADPATSPAAPTVPPVSQSTTEEAPETTPPESDDDPESDVGAGPFVRRTVEVGDGPQAAFADESAVWFTLSRDGAIARLDTRTLIPRTVAVGKNPTRPLVLGDTIWVPCRGDGVVTVINRNSLEKITSIPVGRWPDTPVIAADLVWVTARQDFKLVAIHPENYEIVDEIDLPGYPLTPVLAGGGLWVVGRHSGTVTRVDPFAGATTGPELTVGSGPHAPILVKGEIWISDRKDGTLTIIDPDTWEVSETINVGGTLSRPVLVDGRVWVSDTESLRVVVVDADRRSKPRRIRTSLATTYPAEHAGAFWAADPNAGLVIRIDPVSWTITNEFTVEGSPGAPFSAHGVLWVPDSAGTRVTMIQE